MINQLIVAREQSNVLADFGRQNRTTLPLIQFRRRPPPNRRENRLAKHDHAKLTSPLHLTATVTDE